MADNTNMTFEQWLASKNDLTPQERQVLEERHSNASVTFTPESFDRILDDYRTAASNGSSGQSPRGNRASDNSQAITPEQYQEAIALSKGDLAQMSYDDVAKVWQVVGGLDDKVAQATKPEALQAKQKMADFAEQLMSRLDPNQPWSMQDAPEISEWLKVSNDIQAQNTSQEKKNRNAKIGDSLNKFYKKFDEEHGLSNLTPEHKDMLAANQQAIEAVAANFEPFAKNDKGEYLHPEFANIDKFYDKMEIDNSNSNVDAVDKNKYKQDMAELAYNEAMLELSMNPDFARLQPAQQQELLSQAWANHMQMGMVTMIAAQMAENAAKESGEPKKIKDFENQAKTFINQAVNGENNTFKVTNNAALATLSSRTADVEALSKRIGQKTGHKSLWSKIKELDKKLTKKYPKSYKILKNLAISSAIGLTTGGAGLAVMSACKTIQAARESYKRYKAANTDGEYKSWFGYLKKNPKEAIGLAVSVASTAMSGYMVGMGGITVSDFGLTGQAFHNGLGNTWDMIKDTASNAFSGSNSGGPSFTEQVKNTLNDGNRVARLGISLSGGVSSSMVDFIASFKEKDPEKKKQLRKNAWKTLGGVFTGSVIGLGISGFMHANHDTHNNEDIIHHDKPIGPEEYNPTPRNDFAPDRPDNEPTQPHNPRPYTPTPRVDVPEKGPDMPEIKQPDLSNYTKPSDIPTHIEPINQNILPQTEYEQKLYAELLRGHSIDHDTNLATAAAREDFNHYMQLKNEGNFKAADEFLRGRHDLFENAEHRASNQIADTDSRHVAHAKEEAAQAYNNYQEALKELNSNPNSPEAQAKFDAAAREIAKADVDKYEAVTKQEISNLRDKVETDKMHLEKLGMQRAAYEQESGSLQSVDKHLVKLGLDPNNLPQDVSSLSPEAQEYIRYHNDLNDYQKLEGQLNDRIEATRQEIATHKDTLHNIHSRSEATAEEAVKNMAGYGTYEGSTLQDLNEKIAVESSGHAQTTEHSENSAQPSVSEERLEPQTPQEEAAPVKDQEPVTYQQEEEKTAPVTEEKTDTPATPATEEKTDTPATPATEEKTDTPATPATEEKTDTPAAPATEEKTDTPATPVTGENTDTPAAPATEEKTDTPTAPTTENEAEPVVHNEQFATEVDALRNQFLKENEMLSASESFKAADGSEKTIYYGNSGVMEVYEYTGGNTQARVYENDIADGISDIRYNRDGTRDVTTIDIYGQKTIEHYDASGQPSKVETPETNGTAKTPEERLAYRTQKLEEYKENGVISEDRQQHLQKIAERQIASETAHEGAAAVADQNSGSQEQTETQKRLQEYGVNPKDDLSSVSQDQVHQVDNGGSYYISGDANSYKVASEITVTRSDMQEINAFVDKDIVKGTTSLNGHQISSGIKGTMELRTLAANEKIYDDLVHRSSLGDTLSDAEQAYMHGHETMMNKYGLSHDDNGRLVKTSDLEKGHNPSRNISHGRGGRD